MIYDLFKQKRENENNKKYFDKKGNLAVNVNIDFRTFGKPVVAFFVGKAKNPKYHYSFRDELSAQRFIKEHVETELNRINRKIDEKEEEKQLKKNYKTSLKVGDIMHGSWGYDMTINEFYQIVEIKNRTVIMQEVGVKRSAVSGYYYEEVKPMPNRFIGEPIKRILQINFYNGRAHEYIKLNDVCNLTKCEDLNRYYYENHND